MRRTYSSSDPPPIETTTGVWARASRGSSSAPNASAPGFCSPVSHTIAEAVSAILGVGAPLRGATVMVRLTIAPTLRWSTSPASSRPVPAHPDAMITGVASLQPAELDGEAPLHARHARLPRPGPPPHGGDAARGRRQHRGSSDSQRSHSTRAGLKTGPSTHARRWS